MRILSIHATSIWYSATRKTNLAGSVRYPRGPDVQHSCQYKADCTEAGSGENSKIGEKR